MIVTMAILTTSVMWALARLPARPGEKERLEREAFEANGFAANIAGARGQPATVMHVKSRAAPPTQTRIGAGKRRRSQARRRSRALRAPRRGGRRFFLSRAIREEKGPEGPFLFSSCLRSTDRHT